MAETISIMMNEKQDSTGTILCDKHTYSCEIIKTITKTLFRQKIKRKMSGGNKIRKIPIPQKTGNSL